MNYVNPFPVVLVWKKIKFKITLGVKVFIDGNMLKDFENFLDKFNSIDCIGHVIWSGCDF